MTRIALAVVVFLFCTIASSDEIKRQAPVKWVPIFGFKLPGARPFIDSNSLKITKIGEDKYLNSANILITYDQPVSMPQSNGPALAVKSIVKSVISDCGNGMIAPVYDLYFKEEMPTRQATPIGGLKYPDDIRNTAVMVSPDSPVYKTLCPKYI